MSLPNKAGPDNKWCASPWTEVHIDQEGRIVFCCQSHNIVGNIMDVKLNEIFNAHEYKTARYNTLNNVWPKGCDFCIAQEKKGPWSQRYAQQSPYDNEFDQVDNIPDNPQVIQKIKIDFSNACNLRCTMCNPHRSTGWYKDAKFLLENLGKEAYRAVFIPNNREYGVSQDVVDNNIDAFLNAKLIDVSGGEPFYTPQFKYLVDKLVENNYQGRLKIITNLTLLDDEYLEKLKLIKTSFVVSADGIGDLYEYVRPSTPFGKYKGVDIQKRIIDLHQSGLYGVAMSYTPQLLNLYNILPFISWAEENKLLRNKFNLGMLFNGPLSKPEHLSINTHPDMDYKLYLADILDKHPKRSEQISGLIHRLKAPRTDEDEDNWKFFCKATDLLDKHRKTSILNYIPELEKWWV